MAELQKSRYNQFIDRPDGVVMGYNARTGTFAILATGVAQQLRNAGPISNIGDTDELVEMGFLHAGDELDQLRARYERGRSLDSVDLTLIPTMDCNMCCSYCFQNGQRSTSAMSPEVQTATLRFTEGLLHLGRKKVFLTWYGGEPLLQRDLVLDLTARLRKVVEGFG